MLMEDYVPLDFDDEIMLVGDGQPFIQWDGTCKNYNEFTKLDKSNIFVRDAIYWNRFKKWGMIHLKRLIERTCHCLWFCIVDLLFNLMRYQLLKNSLKRMTNYHKKNQTKMKQLMRMELTYILPTLLIASQIDFMITSDEELEVYIIEFE